MTHQSLTDGEARITAEYVEKGKNVTATFYRAVDLTFSYEPHYEEYEMFEDSYMPARIFRDSVEARLEARILPDESGKYGKFFSTDKPLASKLDKDYDTVVARRVDKGVEVFIGGRWRKVND